MAVFRVQKTQNYTIMSNYHLNDKALSLKAKGLLSLMLSLPDSWDYTRAGWHPSAKRVWTGFGQRFGNWKTPGTSSAAVSVTKAGKCAVWSTRCLSNRRNQNRKIPYRLNLNGKSLCRQNPRRKILHRKIPHN
mgnify:CR=1 FL=1